MPTKAKYPKAMLADLKRSGLGPKDADTLGLEYHDGDPDGYPGYAIPYRGLDGTPTGFYRARYLGAAHELPKDKKGKPQRYSQPKGSGARFYYAHIGGVKWKAVAADPGETVYLTEGEKKAAALCAQGVPCIGLGGVWNWSSDGRAIDDFDDFKWAGRTVKIVFDSDVRDKSDVRDALTRLADVLIRRGAVPSEVELPAIPGDGKTGVDDFLVHHGAKALDKFLALPERPLLIPNGMTFAELAAKRLPAPKWVVEGLIPAGLTILAGKPKIGKSWLTLDLSLAVAGGGKVLGQYEVKGGVALHLALEDTARRFQDRIKRVLDGAPVPGVAYFFNEWPNVEVHGLTALRRWLDTHPDTRLIIIDTLAKMRPAQSARDNLYRVDYEAIGQLKRIADEYALAVVVVHHERKAGADDHIDRVSGSTGLTGAADTIMTLGRERGAMDAVLSITGRDVEEQELALTMELSTMRWRSLGPADDHRMGMERKAILDALNTLGKPASPTEVADVLGKQRRGVNKLMLHMANTGQIEWVTGGTYQLREKGKGSGKF